MRDRAGWVLRIIVAPALAALAGCGGGGGALDGGGDGGVGAYNLNASNMDAAAGIGARVVDAFPPLGDLLDAALVRLGEGTLASGEVAALAACSAGTASLRWTDASGDGAWSAGDTARVDLAACRVHPGDGTTLGGSLALAFSSVASGPPRVVKGQLELALDTAGSRAGTIRGRVALEATAADVAHHGLVFQPAGSSVLSVTGGAAFELGCFDVRDDPNPALGVARRIALLGVIKAGGKILSITPGGRMLYGEDDLPSDGLIGLISLSVPECAPLGVGQGVGDSDGSRMDVSATGAAGEVRLDLFDGAGRLAESRTKSWSDLR